jgi:hypothetical protein
LEHTNYNRNNYDKLRSTKIKLYANREVDFTKDVKLQDNSDGKGVFIAEWNLDIPKPTQWHN